MCVCVYVYIYITMQTHVQPYRQMLTHTHRLTYIVIMDIIYLFIGPIKFLVKILLWKINYSKELTYNLDYFQVSSFLL